MKKGFSLVEILLVLSITILVSVIIYYTYNKITSIVSANRVYNEILIIQEKLNGIYSLKQKISSLEKEKIKKFALNGLIYKKNKYYDSYKNEYSISTGKINLELQVIIQDKSSCSYLVRKLTSSNIGLMREGLFSFLGSKDFYNENQGALGSNANYIPATPQNINTLCYNLNFKNGTILYIES